MDRREALKKMFEQHADLMNQMTPTSLMIALLAFSLAVFLGTVCFVAYNDYDRSHPSERVVP